MRRATLVDFFWWFVATPQKKLTQATLSTHECCPFTGLVYQTLIYCCFTRLEDVNMQVKKEEVCTKTK